MKITVITPSYNQAQYIQATIDSVLSQDYSEIEYVIVDGGSTDGTVEILKSLSDPRVRWISERDAGQPDALNKGLRMTSGEIITFINSDDLLLPGAVRFAAEFFATQPDVDIVYGDGYYVDSAGNRLKGFKSEPFDLKAAILGGQEWAQPGTFWRRQSGNQVGEFDTTLHYRFDFDYYLRMALAGSRLAYVPGERAVYRLHAESKTVSQIDRFMGDWHVLIEKAFARPDLPDDLRQLRPQVDRYIEWHDAKASWLRGDYKQSRPLLRRFFTNSSWGRRSLAICMWIDSYLHTPLTRGLAFVYRQITGSDVMLM